MTELSITGRKLNIFIVFITQSSSTHFFIMKIIHHTLTLKISLRSTKNILPNHVFLVNDATLASDNPLRFRKNLFNI